MTAPSFTQKTMTSSTPAALRAAWCSKYPGICTDDQVGVYAPGRPIKIRVLPCEYSKTFTFDGGKPR